MTKNKIWKLVISIGIALTLWIYVVTVVSPGSTKDFRNVPVDPNNLTGLRDDLIITDYEGSVDIKLQGNRIDLNELDSGSIVIEADLSGIQTADTHRIDYTVRTKGNFASNAFTVEKSSPERLTIKVERKKTKEVPVQVAVVGELPTDADYKYFEDDILVETNTLVVSGPESAVNQIAYAVITVDLEKVTDTIDESFAYTWCDQELNPLEKINRDLVQADLEEVKVTIPIYRKAELQLKVNLIEGGGIWEENCKVTVSPIDKVEVWGTPEALKEMDSLILGEIKLNEVPIQDTYWEQIFELDMAKYENIQVPKGADLPETVTVRVDFINLSTREIDVPSSQFTVTGDQKMKADIVSDSLTIELRGDKTQLEQLTAADILVELDVSDKNVGRVSVMPKVTVDEKYGNVAVIGKFYQVDVELAARS